MRRTLLFAILVSTCVAAGASAQERQSTIQGFGGLRVGAGSFGSTASTETAFGGAITGSLTPNIQIIGEVGRLSSVLPPTVDLALGFLPFDTRVSAWYGQGGVRLIAPPAGVRPYGEASAGIARLRAGVGLDAGVYSPIANAALQFLDRTSPIATVGAGVSFESGPLVVDTGYRYHRIFADNWLQSLALGGDLNVSEIRIGLGVRF
jgi:opacity protein-like surface antigen